MLKDQIENTRPVVILTGFLGAGKTTFLNHLLLENSDKRYAIVENEFGEQGIDNELIVRQDDSIVELNNGCLCCTLSDNLYDILNELFDRRSEFDEIIIEATGLADPTGLAKPFIAHPLIKKTFPLVSIICIIDAELIETHLDETKEAIKQIAYSDILLINKVDLVSPSYVDILEGKLKKLNPLARIVRGSENGYPGLQYHGSLKILEDQLRSSGEVLSEDSQLSLPFESRDVHHHHEHTSEVTSHSFKFNRSFKFQRLYHELLVYLTFQSQGLFRIKGLVWLEDEEDRYILQSVGKRLDFQKDTSLKTDSDKQSIIVFIGKNLKRQGLEKLLDKCLAQELVTHNGS